MLRWDRNAGEDKRGEFVERADTEAFLYDIIRVYEKHQMSLGHEDHHGAFLIEPLEDENIKWLLQALIDGA